jgi:hypothetical protein
MGKIEKEALRVAPAPATAGAPGDQLRGLVRFAMRQGYYDLWNMPLELGVRPCSSTDFPTDSRWVSR